MYLFQKKYIAGGWVLVLIPPSLAIQNGGALDCLSTL